MKMFRILKERKDTSDKQYETKVIYKYFPDKETARKYSGWLNRKHKGFTYKVNGVAKRDG